MEKKQTKIQTPLLKLKALCKFRFAIKKFPKNIRTQTRTIFKLHTYLREEVEKEGNKIKIQNAKLRNCYIW